MRPAALLRSVMLGSLLLLTFQIPLAAPARAEVPEHPPALRTAPAFPDRSVLVSFDVAAGYGTSGPIKTVYAKKMPLLGGMRAAFLFDERFGVGGGASVWFRKGTGTAPDGQTAPETWLWQVPIEVEGSLRGIAWRAQPVVPYVRGGFSAVVWRESWGDADGAKEFVEGVKFGVHVGGGAQVRLPFPEINLRNRRIGDPVLDDIWLHLEGWARSASNFGAEGLDLSAVGVSAGITLLM